LTFGLARKISKCDELTNDIRDYIGVEPFRWQLGFGCSFFMLSNSFGKFFIG
jgi:hypothetical protein